MTKDIKPDPSAGLVVGGRGGPEDELLEDGQEEVFAREEVETGRIEHHSETGSVAVSDSGKSTQGVTRPR
jgi:hypothetical protein